MTSLAAMNTLGVPSEAADVRVISSEETLLEAFRATREEGVRPVVLGGGSNVVLPEHVHSPVWLVRNRGLSLGRESRGEVEVTVAAGESWHGLVRWSLGMGLSGLENMALIPGSAGAAPVQNIGAYGEELAARFTGVDALDMATGRIERMGAEELAFGYRTSALKRAPGAYVILRLVLRLRTGGGEVNTTYPDVAEELGRMGRVRTPRPVDIAEAVVRVRRRKLPDPRRVPNAGSFFKNPVVEAPLYQALTRSHGPLRQYPDPGGIKLAAAELIDKCIQASELPVRWALRDAPVRVWDRQKLVLTNPGRRTGGEVLAVAGQIQLAVEARFGIRLQLEPDVVEG